MKSSHVALGPPTESDVPFPKHPSTSCHARSILNSGCLSAEMWYCDIPAARAFLLFWYVKKRKNTQSSCNKEPWAENNRVLKCYWPVHWNKTTFIILEQQNLFLFLKQQSTLCTPAKQSLLVHSAISKKDLCINHWKRLRHQCALTCV